MAFSFTSSPITQTSSAPKRSRLLTILYSLPPRVRAGVYVLLGIFFLSTYSLFVVIDNRYGTNAPVHGGTFTEGTAGTLRFINPLLAFSEPDKDLTTLVFSGLLKRQGKEYVPDLAASYTISPDGKVYTFTLADKRFQDGKPVTADDVVFTINTIKNDLTKSPLAPSWQGVSVSSSDKKTVVFTLDQPYAPFLENLTVGILPAHIWQNVKPEEMLFSTRNLSPVGSGPYRVLNVAESDAGIPQSVTLVSFKQSNIEPYISTLVFKIFTSEDDVARALMSRDIDAAARLSAESATKFSGKNFQILQSPLPRIFAVFFNPKHAPVLDHPEVRLALTQAINTPTIIEKTLGGFATQLSGPFQFMNASTASTSTDAAAAAAQATLQAAGWQRGPDGIFQKTTSGKNPLTERLSFGLATGNAPELTAAAELMQKMWRDAGIEVTTKFFETGDLNQQSVRPRTFDLLFFGEYEGNFPDPYAFWHSSQRDDPGLNVADYSNKDADTLMEDLRKEPDAAKRAEEYQALGDILTRDNPAIFLYAPNLVYILSKPIGGLTLSPGNAQDRFSSVASWYVRTDRVWNVFLKK